MLLVGKAAIYIAVALGAVAGCIALWSTRDEDREELGVNAYWLSVIVFVALTVAIIILLGAFISKDYTFLYVAENSSADMSLFYRIAALWAGQEGSLLLWAWLLAGATAIIAWRRVEERDSLVTNALGVLNILLVFFVAVLITHGGDPFKVAAAGQAVGRGINPLLLHWAMVLHPPTLFVGYAGLAVPFAFALGALIEGDTSKRWLKLSDRWAVGAWLFLSIGIFLGAAWAYVVLGWGGFWGWDPVENSSFLPWLTGTAMLHSFTMWKRRNSFKFWSVSLAGATFFLTLLATYITRSGILSQESTHTFPGEPAFKLVFELFMIATIAATVGLMAWRYYELRSAGFGSGAEGAPEGLLTKEFIYYLNNVFMVLAAVIIGYATLAPVITPALGMQKVSYNAAFYNNLAAPLSIVYLMGLAICPIMSWKRTDPWRMGRLLVWPGAAAALAAVWIVPTFGSNWVGATGMIVAVLAAAAAVQLFVRGALQRSASKGISPFAALGELFLRNRSQAGGYVVHLGVALTVLGTIGSVMYTSESEVSLANKAGAKAWAARIRVEVVGYDKKTYPRMQAAPSTYVVERHTLKLKLAERGGAGELGVVAPILKGYQNNLDQDRGPSPEVDIRWLPLRDVFVTFQGVNTDGTLSVKVTINPLISFVWLGSAILILGTAWAMWPGGAEAQAKTRAEAA